MGSSTTDHPDAFERKMDQPGKFLVYVFTSNVVHIEVEAESGAAAEQMVKDWINNDDERFYNCYSGPIDGDSFDLDSVDADIAL